MNKHNSMRGYFAYELYKQMEKDEDIVLLMGDLGYGMFDEHRKAFPDRCYNTGACEFSMMAMAVGLSLAGKKPVVYSITPFLLYRPFEILRTYINYEKIPVIMVGGGRGKDYAHDGISHWADDDMDFMGQLQNIVSVFPLKKEEVTGALVKKILELDKPVYINLCR